MGRGRCFAYSPITHLLLSGPVPKRSWTSTRGLGTPVLARSLAGPSSHSMLPRWVHIHASSPWLAGRSPSLVSGPFQSLCTSSCRQLRRGSAKGGQAPTLHQKGTEGRQAVLWIKKSLPFGPHPRMEHRRKEARGKRSGSQEAGGHFPVGPPPAGYIMTCHLSQPL